MRHIKTQNGFSLIEMLVGTGLLAMLMGSVFFAFGWATRAFHESNTRQNAQAELTRSYVRLREDLRQTHFRSASTFRRSTTHAGRDVHRDALCIVGLRNWTDPDSFDALNGLPKWDRYVVYYGTYSGHLVRSLIDPQSPDYSPGPLYEFSQTLHLSEDPGLNDPQQASYTVLSRSLDNFRVELEPARDMVKVVCSMRNTVGTRTETAEVKFDVSPQNTWPKAEV